MINAIYAIYVVHLKLDSSIKIDFLINKKPLTKKTASPKNMNEAYPMKFPKTAYADKRSEMCASFWVHSSTFPHFTTSLLDEHFIQMSDLMSDLMSDSMSEFVTLDSAPSVAALSQDPTLMALLEGFEDVVLDQETLDELAAFGVPSDAGFTSFDLRERLGSALPPTPTLLSPTPAPMPASMDRAFSFDPLVDVEEVLMCSFPPLVAAAPAAAAAEPFIVVGGQDFRPVRKSCPWSKEVMKTVTAMSEEHIEASWLGGQLPNVSPAEYLELKEARRRALMRKGANGRRLLAQADIKRAHELGKAEADSKNQVYLTPDEAETFINGLVRERDELRALLVQKGHIF